LIGSALFYRHFEGKMKWGINKTKMMRAARLKKA